MSSNAHAAPVIPIAGMSTQPAATDPSDAAANAIASKWWAFVDIGTAELVNHSELASATSSRT